MDDGSLIFMPPAYTASLYTCDVSTLTFSKYLEFGLTNEYISKQDVVDADENVPQLMKSGKEIILNKLVSANRIVLWNSHGASARDMSISVLDRKGGRHVRKITLYDNGKRRFPMIYYIDDNYAYAALDVEIIRENPQLVQGFDNDVVPELAAIEPESLVLVKYRFKTI